ncbi:GH1 family beta-glucosidase [Microbacterium horticulturae]|uniref:Beta-glucosidase n=1 Tax=Microbacterium horticulturae TaxID=3028316 RepID=A0ABY8C1N5_9MICO|nr:GH1 family beta-glucosidase [Microbacterium sp. KACC 23027]WEG10360.1 GH1 family beta-glucosidase [Microbacterium sp. KACC 23027]
MSQPTFDPRQLAARFRVPLRWSAATSSFQIEGARTGDGRGRSIWDTQVAVPGWVKDASTAEPGPDSYHRYRDDIALLRELGVDRYRFSLSWVRIQPDGTGPAEPRGLDYYDRLIDGLLDAGITPFPTLYHWDHPQQLEDAGGWLSRDMADRFADFAGIAADRFGDRVRQWYTINEPVSMSLQGYGLGTLAPARQLLFGALSTVHHQLLAHGRAVRALRAAGATEIGIPNNHTLVRALHADDGASVATYDLLHNRIFADPLLTGEYPDLETFGLPPMPVRGDDMAVIATPLDFYGINFYNPTTVTRATQPGPLPFELVPTPGMPVTGFGPEWPIDPAALRELLIDFRDRYGDRLPPVVIGENGASFPEPEAATRVQDDDRIAYLAGHIAAVADAIDAGVDVREYTVWSLLDNFEWADGFTQRFGLVHVDQHTSQRTPKASFDWYRALIREAHA